MNYKYFSAILVFIVIIITSFICCQKSTMHKPFFIATVNENIINTSDKTTIQEIEKENIKSNKNNQEKITGTELIWWNQWKSNLHNKFQRDISIKEFLDIPDEYYFVINFDVTNDGKILNINLEGYPKNYCKKWEIDSTQILKSYEGTSLLNFPPKTNLKIKHVVFEFSSLGETKPTTPEDFANDYELINYEKQRR